MGSAPFDYIISLAGRLLPRTEEDALYTNSFKEDECPVNDPKKIGNIFQKVKIQIECQIFMIENEKCMEYNITTGLLRSLEPN